MSTMNDDNDKEKQNGDAVADDAQQGAAESESNLRRKLDEQRERRARAEAAKRNDGIIDVLSSALRAPSKAPAAKPLSLEEEVIQIKNHLAMDIERKEDDMNKRDFIEFIQKSDFDLVKSMEDLELDILYKDYKREILSSESPRSDYEILREQEDYLQKKFDKMMNTDKMKKKYLANLENGETADGKNEKNSAASEGKVDGLGAQQIKTISSKSISNAPTNVVSSSKKGWTEKQWDEHFAKIGGGLRK